MVLRSLKKYKYWLFTVLLFILAVCVEQYYIGKSNDVRYWSKMVSIRLCNAQKDLKNSLNKIAKTIGSNGVVPDCTNNIDVGRGFLVLIYKDQLLSYWSDNLPAINNHLILESGNNQLIRLKNGWYQVIWPDNVRLIKNGSTYRIIGLLLIKNEYAYQNQYLSNKFNPELNLPDYADIQVTGFKDEAAVLTNNGHYLFSLNFKKYGQGGNFNNLISLFLYALAAFLALLLIHRAVKALLRQSIANIWIVIVAIELLRWLMIYYKWPIAIYKTTLFNPSIYSTSFYFNSLGDLLLNVLLFFYIILSVYPFLYQLYSPIEQLRKYKWSMAFIVIALCGIYGAGLYIHYLVSGLIISSRIVFSFNNIFELDRFSFVGFLIFCVLFFSFHFLTDGVLRLVKRFKLSITEKLTLFMLSLCIFLFVMLMMKQAGVLSGGFNAFAMAVGMVVLVQYYHEGNDYNFSLTKGIAAIIIFSLYGAHTIFVLDAAKEEINRKVLAVKLESNHDYNAEQLFADISEKMLVDKVLLSTIYNSDNPQIAIDKRIRQLYFKGYWQKYDLNVMCFDSLGNNLLKNNKNNLSHFDRMINEQGETSNIAMLHFIHTSSGRTAYVAKIPLRDSENKNKLYGNIIINIESKFLQEDKGFPELVLSDNLNTPNELSGYSYARYKNGQMVSRFGSFAYNYSLSTLNIIDGFEYHNFDGYSHLYYKAKDNSLIVISKPLQGIVEYVTLFFYIFSLILLFVFVVMIVGRVPSNYFSQQLSFKIRIQLSILAIVIVSLFIVGGGTVYYFIAKYNAQQYDFVLRETSSILLDIESWLNENERITFDDETMVEMSELSAKADFNIYDVQGDLMFSTQPKIIDRGIISTKMPWQTWYEFSFFKKSQSVHNERIGKLTYIAAYEPIRNIHGLVVGYLNLPYFSKQTELRKEISSFLITLINVYALLFVLAITTAYFLSIRITRPLRLIQDSLANLSLNKKNKLIEWEKKDEIGALISEYNRMVNELANSAEMLAKSERETAWTEMAKQVAHEIKNPLTPMKLSLQYLQKAMKEKTGDVDKLFTRITHSLIQQIDDLSLIATAFSSFAQMPDANNELINLEQIVRNTVNLYKQVDNVTIEYSQAIIASQQQTPLYVFADKEQLFRVFSNLTKNAIQAIPDGKQGLIKMEIFSDEDAYIVAISDNGIGISDEGRHKIFMPNFTTKSTGTGLGLAMIKNIMESMGGKIWFESHVGIGTTFFVKITKYKG
jgi:two-component system nitrogen regulation sensor histidine kinase NtrY